MREIKFRIWDGNKMNYNPKIAYNEGYYSYPVNDFFRNIHSEERCIEIYMQYTGLKDKNGKEIYEGDIIEFSGEVGQVYFSSHGAWSYSSVNSHLLLFDKCCKIAIIGNIYENPGLLKGLYER